MMKKGTIKVEVFFFDEDGERACAKDFTTGEVCPYYRTQNFGTRETCCFAPDDGKKMALLERRGDDSLGSLIPGDWCPIKET